MICTCCRFISSVSHVRAAPLPSQCFQLIPEVRAVLQAPIPWLFQLQNSIAFLAGRMVSSLISGGEGGAIEGAGACSNTQQTQQCWQNTKLLSMGLEEYYQVGVSSSLLALFRVLLFVNSLLCQLVFCSMCAVSRNSRVFPALSLSDSLLLSFLCAFLCHIYGSSGMSCASQCRLGDLRCYPFDLCFAAGFCLFLWHTVHFCCGLSCAYLVSSLLLLLSFYAMFAFA